VENVRRYKTGYAPFSLTDARFASNAASFHGTVGHIRARRPRVAAHACFWSLIALRLIDSMCLPSVCNRGSNTNIGNIATTLLLLLRRLCWKMFLVQPREAPTTWSQPQASGNESSANRLPHTPPARTPPRNFQYGTTLDTCHNEATTVLLAEWMTVRS
jgi:hypothetical protein